MTNMEIPLSAALSGDIPVVVAYNHGGVRSTTKASWMKRNPFLLYGPSAAQASVWIAFGQRASQAKGQHTGYQMVELHGIKSEGEVKELAGGAIYVGKGGRINVTGAKRAPHPRAFQRWMVQGNELVAVTSAR